MTLDRLDAALWRNAACEDDVAHAMLAANLDQLEQHRVHGYQVHAERLAGQFPGRGDLAVEQFGCHRSAGDYSEAAGIADSRDEVALGNPAHRAAQDGVFGAEEIAAALHQGLGLGISRHCGLSRGNWRWP